MRGGEGAIIGRVVSGLYLSPLTSVFHFVLLLMSAALLRFFHQGFLLLLILPLKSLSSSEPGGNVDNCICVKCSMVGLFGQDASE